MNKKQKEYVSPVIKCVCFLPEKGFATTFDNKNKPLTDPTVGSTPGTWS